MYDHLTAGQLVTRGKGGDAGAGQRYHVRYSMSFEVMIFASLLCWSGTGSYGKFSTEVQSFKVGVGMMDLVPGGATEPGGPLVQVKFGGGSTP